MCPELIATYRLQFCPGFGFDEAAALVEYLRRLGVSHVYCSPYLQARPGSTHGYDSVDPTRVNEELGGAAGHARFCQALASAGLGQILDVVPNHMAIGGRDNAWWWDVLENGPTSRYAAFFDIDWNPAMPGAANRVLLPVLGDRYARVLDAKDLRLERDGGGFVLRYHEHAFPLAPRSLAGLPAADAAVAELNANPQAMDRLLEQQNYRLAYWRISSSTVGYRRFFDINHLAGLRVEDEAVFDETHALILQWLDQGVLAGVRIDHIDGLFDPAQYLLRLRGAAPDAWIVVEKILGPGEQLPAAWGVAGTTGYDFVNLVNSLFVDADGEKPLTETCVEFTGQSADFAAIVREKKHQALRELLSGDVNRLAALLARICERNRRLRDYTLNDLDGALRELVACFPVYRSYVCPGPDGVGEDDVRYVSQAVEAARLSRPDLDGLLEFLRDLLLLRIEGDVERELALRFQQLTGPAMAKGVEDTTFYCFNRFISLNEVGGDPARFGLGVDEFHGACQEMQRLRPRGMLATSTHDTKRSEDVRARLNLLSEIPDLWRAAVLRWSEINAPHHVGQFPDRNAEYFLYQTLVGAWPINADRVAACMMKAAREAKVYTSWTRPNAEYEAALERFVRGILADGEFRADMGRFVAPLVVPTAVNSLAQTLLKLTAPGIPDIYQGTELLDFSLVDPDNRRPVDYALRLRLLDELDAATPEATWTRTEQGLPKMHVIRQTLALRRSMPECFGAAADNRPLAAHGDKTGHVVAFVRGGGAVTLVPRLPIRLGGDWANTSLTLPGGRWRNELTGDSAAGTMPVAELLQRFPVALLSQRKAGQS